MQCKMVMAAMNLPRMDTIGDRTDIFTWIQTGLVALYGGFITVFNSYVHKVVPYVIGGLLVIWGANIYAIIHYHRSCVRLLQKGLSKNSLSAMILIKAFLLIIAALVFWITLQ